MCYSRIVGYSEIIQDQSPQTGIAPELILDLCKIAFSLGEGSRRGREQGPGKKPAKLTGV
jgi:hypothetical protein